MSSQKKSLNDPFKEFSNQSHKSYIFQILRERSKFVYTYEKKYVFNIAIPFIWYQKREIILFKLGIKKVGCFLSTALYWKILCKYFFLLRDGMGLKPLFTFRKKEKYFNKHWQKILIHCSYFNFMFRCRISFSLTPSRNQTEDLLVARNETYLLLATKSCLVV